MKKQQKSNWMLRILVPVALVVTWFAVAGVGGPYFGKIEEVANNDPATYLPESAEATRVNEKLKEFRDSSTIPAIVILESNEKFNAEQKEAAVSVRDAIAESGLAADDISPPVASDDGKASIILVPIGSEAEFAEVVPELTALVKESNDETGENLNTALTGPALFSRDLQDAFAGIDGTLLVVALSVVFVILLVVYRSPILPFVTLASAVVALSGAIMVVYLLAKEDIVLLNGQVQGILFILVIGAATDYALLYVARYREELIRNKDKWQASKITWRASVEPIVAAGGTVILGLLCLLVSDLGSNKALGPVGGLGILFAMLSALTFLPSALMLLGRTAFWPKRPKYTKQKTQMDYRSTHPFWTRVGDLVSKYPRKIWVGITVLLLLACLAVPQLKATGVSQSNLILGESDARDGQKILNEHFSEGSGSPTYAVVPEDDLQKVSQLIESNQGVDAVSVISDDPEKPEVPLGLQRAEILSEIKSQVKKELDKQRNSIRSGIEGQLTGAPESAIDSAYESAVANLPEENELVEKAYPFSDVEPKVIDGDVMVQATLVDEPSSIEARETVTGLRQNIQTKYPTVEFGGVSAIQQDTNAASERDLYVIIPLILVVITAVLMLLLRSIIAPLILVLTTVVSFGATLGIAALAFNHIWNFPGADPSVIIFGFVFLVALGIDYNIFLMTRVREETIIHGIRKGTLKALIVTGGVITSAGVVLAATFAALNVIPILFLAQIAFIVAFGVLLDTLIVRSLLVPALTLEIGKFIWWPSKISRKVKE